jgi:hypothetical protein
MTAARRHGAAWLDGTQNRRRLGRHYRLAGGRGMPMKLGRVLFIVAVLTLALMPSLAAAGGGVFAGAARGRAMVATPSAVVVRPAPRVFVATPSGSVAVVFPQFPKFGTPVIVAHPFFPMVVSVPPAIVIEQPVVFAPSPVVSVAPALPTPTLIEYSTGWFQLRGDGITTPYQWVWIPKSPPPPPSEAPPTVPPVSPSPPPAHRPTNPEGEPRSSSVPRELYRWTDEHGVVHLTDSFADIPERYRSMAQRGGWSMEPVTLRLRY